CCRRHPTAPVSLFRPITPLPPRASTLFPYTTLFRSVLQRARRVIGDAQARPHHRREQADLGNQLGDVAREPRDIGGALGITVVRSEEHTSELQSREKLVCRLLLEKKK